MNPRPLFDFAPFFVGTGGEGVSDRNGNPVPRREGVGLQFNCPCGCPQVVFVPFQNAFDGSDYDANGWHRVGDTLSTLSLTPSIFKNPAKGGCGWHGYVTNGEVITV